MDGNESDRLARLEREMAILRSEFARLRERVGLAGDRERTAEPPPPPRPTAPADDARPAPEPPRTPTSPEPPRPGRSLEELIGRHGTIVVATILILVAVGSFLTWAIQKGLLGPEVRVVLGYLAAIGLAVGGARVRMRGTREFGNVLLAMALGVVHLVCWSAGPLLHVLPSTLALTIGFFASVALAEFALRHDEEALCAIGFGGAAIAPFLTSDRSGNVIALAIYGLVVVALSASSLGDRRWPRALGVTLVSIGVYTLAVTGLAPPVSAWPWIGKHLGVLFPMAVVVAVLPLASARHRLTVIRFAIGVLIVAAVLRVNDDPDPWAVVLTISATILSIGALHVFRSGTIQQEDEGAGDERRAERNALTDAVILPLGLFVAAVIATPSPTSSQSVAVATLWAVLALYMSHLTRGESYADRYAATATVTALWIAPAALWGHARAQVLGEVATALALMAIGLQLPRRPFAPGSVVALVVASTWALASLTDRVPFEYLPFGTIATVVTIVAIGGWLAVGRIARRATFHPSPSDSDRSLLISVLTIGAGATAFLWGHAELAGAWNPTAATALLIVYYAAAGALMIWLGRRRSIRSLRLIGLGLSLLAAGKAVVEALQLPNVAVRIAVFFAVAAFLIAVGYWYRGAGDDSAPAA